MDEESGVFLEGELVGSCKKCSFQEMRNEIKELDVMLKWFMNEKREMYMRWRNYEVWEFVNCKK